MEKVKLNDVLYFNVDKYSYNLYAKRKDRKTDELLGYYTNLEALLNKATQYLLSKKEGEVSFKEFITEWNKIQLDLSDQINVFKQNIL